MAAYASRVCMTVGALLAAMSFAIADPPGAAKPLADKGGTKVNTIGEKVPAATDCVAKKNCKKAHTQSSGATTNAADYKKPPGS